MARLIVAWFEKNLVGTDNPRQQGKGLMANKSDLWRYHIGDFRLIADISDVNCSF
jgi:mRNA interferase RelE/StbE